MYRSRKVRKETSKVKISRSRLKRIVEEELSTVLKEASLETEANLYHKKDGTWGSKKTGNVKSLSVAAGKRLGIDSKHHGKGIVAKDPDKTRVKYHMSTCGRTHAISGKPIDRKYSCRDYPKEYQSEGLLDEDEELAEGPEEVARAYQRGSIELAVKDALKKNEKVQPCDLEAILSFLDRYNRAEDGKLNDPNGS